MAFRFVSNLLSRFKTSAIRTPTLIQMENVECGAAALGIILGYYRRIVPLAELRRECGVSRDGSRASNVLKAARLYGLEAKGFKASMENVQKYPLPFIVFWNFNHFLVVEQFGKNRIYLNDPAAGRRTVTYEEFSRAYTGILLAMQPGPDFQPGGKKTSAFSALLTRLKPFRTLLSISLLAGLFLTLPRLALPAFAQIFIDEVLVQNRQDWLRPLILAMGVTLLLQVLLAHLRFTSLRRLLIQLSVTTSGKFLWHTLRLPLSFYAQRFAGEISDRARLNDKVAGVITGQLAPTVIDLIMIFLYGGIMLIYDWVLTLITVLFAVLNLVALKVLASSRQDANSKLAQDAGKLSGVAIGGIQCIESAKASGLESDLFSKFAGYHAKLLNSQRQISVPNQFLASLPNLLNSIAVAAILVIGGFRVMDGSLSIGMLIAYQSLAGSFLSPFTTLLNFGSTLQDLEADLNRLDDVLQNPVDPESDRSVFDQVSLNQSSLNQSSLSQSSLARRTPGTRPALQPFRQAIDLSNFQLQGFVELRSVTFGYNRLEAPLVQDFSVTVKPGQRIALVGGSGSGKSTVAKIATGLYLPWEGEILLDGIPRSQIPRSVLANSLAMVEQEIFLFAGSVKENLTLWDPTIAIEDIVQACKDAAIHDVILSLPGGYEAHLAEGGSNLSGGQRQRLEIARALVRNPAVLVLDEATSALDAETELTINRNLQRRGCSCIIVAHRLSTIRDCDEILVLERGKVVQRGTHEDLRQQRGAYQKLIHTTEKELAGTR